MSLPKPELVYEIIGVYFSNIYFVDLYRQSEREYETNNQYPSLEKSYYETVIRFNESVKQRKNTHGQEYFPKLMNGLKKTFNQYLNKSYTYTDMISMLVYTFTSETTTPKEDRFKIVVRSIITKTVDNYTYTILNQKIKQAVHSKRKQASPQKLLRINRSWKDLFVQLLKQEINRFASAFTAKKLGIKQDNNSSLITDYQQQIEKLTQEKIKLSKNFNKLVDHANNLLQQVKNQEQLIQQYKQLQTRQQISLTPELPKHHYPERSDHSKHKQLEQHYPKHNQLEHHKQHLDSYQPDPHTGQSQTGVNKNTQPSVGYQSDSNSSLENENNFTSAESDSENTPEDTNTEYPNEHNRENNPRQTDNNNYQAAVEQKNNNSKEHTSDQSATEHSENQSDSENIVESPYFNNVEIVSSEDE